MDYFDLDAYENPFAGIQAFIHEACFGETPTVPKAPQYSFFRFGKRGLSMDIEGFDPDKPRRRRAKRRKKPTQE